MSLSAGTDSVAMKAPTRLLLRAAENYDVWRARIDNECWAATHLSIFTLTDAECLERVTAFDKGEHKTPQMDLIGQCWKLIFNSLHDELLVKLVHVRQGCISSLLREIRSALLVAMADDVQPIRIELYSASMTKEGNCDLQTYISYILLRRDKLKFLGVDIPNAEIAQVFLRGLPSVFQPLQLHYSIPGNAIDKFEDLVDTTRRFASTPVVVAELLRVKSASGAPSPQSIMISTERDRQANPNKPNKQRPFCFQYSKGSCSFGDKCRFYHGSANSASSSSSNQENKRKYCKYCRNQGHTLENCPKLSGRTQNPTSLTMSAPPIRTVRPRRRVEPPDCLQLQQRRPISRLGAGGPER